ncbi:MAG: oxygen-independent coproporphyrinogen III oxidase [Alphaproteobacteria bacterium]|jgi:oxygen-independent coproporphyrinogen-3 oxidase|nr:oxygen-independent coproporphyrinogen III oxidase [Alphaproteobacteria bacterium]
MNQTAALPHITPETGDGFTLDDPFFGLLGQKSGRDDLWLGKAVPRYTSYPPATAFRDGVSAQQYRDVLAQIAPEEPVSLYLHIPYCRTICLYCGCHTCATQKHEDVSNYLEHVHKELEQVALSAKRQRRVSHIHLGGGSPNIMTEKDMGLLFGALARRFDMSSCQEVAIELDARLITKAQARTLAMMGVTRVSLGVQDFNPEVQSAIGRIQPYEMVKEACDLLRTYGIEKINFDLMYGLPFQSPTSLAQTARQAARLHPSRIALFSYAHVPQVKKHQRALEQYIMPGPHAALAMESLARKTLVDAGYVEIGMDHFAHPDDTLAKAAADKRLRRTFQGYTDDCAGSLLGIGASSIGTSKGHFFQNAHGIEDYVQALRTEGFATKRGLVMTGEDKLRAAIIESLMCTMSVNLETVCRKHNFSLVTLNAEIAALEPFEAMGVIHLDGYKITLAIPHRMAVRVVASLFDKKQRNEHTPVSRAV